MLAEFLKRFFKDLFLMCIGVLPLCMSVRVLGSLELELQTVSCQNGSWKLNLDSLEEQPVPESAGFMTTLMPWSLYGLDSWFNLKILHRDRNTGNKR